MSPTKALPVLPSAPRVIRTSTRWINCYTGKERKEVQKVEGGEERQIFELCVQHSETTNFSSLNQFPDAYNTYLC